MGQAKQRGTFEQRKAEAVNREATRHNQIQKVRSVGKSRFNTLLASALAMSAGVALK